MLSTYICVKNCAFNALSSKEGLIKKEFVVGNKYELDDTADNYPQYFSKVGPATEHDPHMVETMDALAEVVRAAINSEKLEEDFDDEDDDFDEDYNCGDPECPACGNEEPVAKKATQNPPAPKYKVGDYVVAEGPNPPEYMKIICVQYVNGEFRYNNGGSSYYREAMLRKPTLAEMSRFYR